MGDTAGTDQKQFILVPETDLAVMDLMRTVVRCISNHLWGPMITHLANGTHWFPASRDIIILTYCENKQDELFILWKCCEATMQITRECHIVRT